MNLRSLYSLLLVFFCASFLAKSQAPSVDSHFKTAVNPSSNQQSITKIPQQVILVKGASSSASDAVTPVPEGAAVDQNVFRDPYFGISYTLPQGWSQEFEGPPPSETGRYVLAQIGPPSTEDGPASASILITAQDMFFTRLPAANAFELAEYTSGHLQNYYSLEHAPTLVNLAGRPFSFFSYGSPVAELHWYVLAIQIRCHAVQFVLTGRDTKLLDRLMVELNKMKLPVGAGATAGDGGGLFPLCIKDYARDENVIARADPLLTEHRFNPVPVRIIIDRQGKIKHIHLISAFPDQAKAITDALQQWRFKPYAIDGKASEVETGILFGRAPQPGAPRAGAALR